MNKYLSTCICRKLHSTTTMNCLPTTHLLLLTAMILTLLYNPASTLDIGRHGERIILQSDVETIFIATPMRDIQSLLYTLGNNTQHIQKKILTPTR